MSRSGRILILGASGQVGRELQRSFVGAGELLCPGRSEADLASPDKLRETVRNVQPDVILNAAAYTAVDRAETERDLAFAVNAEAPRVLAEEAARCNALLVHYSTDYVFDGSKRGPWLETDPANPLNVYGASKLAGEIAIQAAGGNYLIFRTSWVYGPHGKNFLFTMLRLGRERDHLQIVDDQTGAPTTSIALAEATRTIVERALAGDYGTPSGWIGLYHMTCAGSVTWFGFARRIFECYGVLLGKRPPEIVPTDSANYKTDAKRPLNSALSNRKLLECFGIALPAWDAALDRVLATMVVPQFTETEHGAS